MADSSQPNALQTFLSQLSPEERTRIQTALNSADRVAFLNQHVSPLLQSHPEINLGGFTWDNVLDDAGRQWDERLLPNAPTPQTAEPTQQPDILAQLFPKNDSGHGGGVGLTQDKNTNDLLLSLQKEILLKDAGAYQLFQDLQKNPDPQKLETLANMLDAKSLVGNQRDIIQRLIGSFIQKSDLTADKKQELLGQIATHFSQKATEARETFDTNDTFEDARQNNAALKDKLQKALTITDPKESRKALQTIIDEQQKLIPGLQVKQVQEYGPFSANASYYQEFEKALREELSRLSTVPYSVVEVGVRPGSIGEISTAQITPGAPEVIIPNEPTFQQNQRGKSSTGRALSRARNLARGARRIEKTVSKAGKAAKTASFLGRIGAFLAANPEVLVALGVAFLVILLILGAFLLLIFVIIPLLQQQSTPTASLAGSCEPSITCVQKLQAFGINVSGDLSLNGDPYGKAKLTYDTLSFITQPPSKFGTLLGLPQKTIFLSFYSGGCAGHASTNGTVALYGFGACGTNVAKFMLIHELGHEIAFRNPDLYNKFYSQFPFVVLLFYKLPTWNCEFDYGKGPFPGECFADTIGEYVLYKDYRNQVGGSPAYFEHNFSTFKTLFAPFYNFAKDNVYGGLEF